MRNTKGQFQLGHSGGRPKGARNRLAAQVFEDILRHWCTPAAPGSKLCKGAEALETLYKEKPGEYLRLTASVRQALGRGGRAHDLWRRFFGDVSTGSRVRREDSQGREAYRPAGRAGHEIRVCRQPQDRKSDRS